MKDGLSFKCNEDLFFLMINFASFGIITIDKRNNHEQGRSYRRRIIHAGQSTEFHRGACGERFE
jgi:hypothetical protein